jgi:hypothetical protein
VHLSGYFEPNKDDMDDGMMFDQGDDEEEDDEELLDEDELEALHKGGKLDKNLKQA